MGVAANSVGIADVQAADDATTSQSPWQVVDKMTVDKIWSAVRVGFALNTHGDKQYIAYYNADRRMVVGMRLLSDDEFTKYILPSTSIRRGICTWRATCTPGR